MLHSYIFTDIYTNLEYLKQVVTEHEERAQA